MRITSTARAAALVASVALAGGVATAQDETRQTDRLPGRSPSGPVGTSSADSTGPGSTTAAVAGDCGRQMSGTVKIVDRAAGTVSIGIPGGEDVLLRLPSQQLDGFDEGDQVIVSMGVRREGENRDGGIHDDRMDPTRSVGSATDTGR